MSRRLLAPLAVAAVVTGATLASAVSWPVLPSTAPPAAAAPSGPVIERNLVCPDLSGSPGETRTRLTVAALPGAGRGTAAVSAVQGRFPVPLPTVSTSTGTARLDVASRGGAVLVDAHGPIAAGVAAEQVTRTSGGPGRGLTETRCAPAAPESWFVGGATTVDSFATLRLVNPDPVPATADVSVLTTTGPVDPRSAQGIDVPPAGSVDLALESLAPGSTALATHVSVTSGRLVAAVLDVRHAADLPLGGDYVPASGAGPARVAVVPGLLPGSGYRRVVLATPGPDDATVTLRVVSGDGAFVPTSLNAVRVPAGTVVQVDLAPILRGAAAAVEVTSDVPVVAGAVSGQSDPRTGATDFSWTGAGPALTGSALVPDNRLGGGVDTLLVLSAPGAAAAVTVTAFAAGRRPAAPRRIPVPAGRTVAVSVRTLGLPAGSFALVVRPAVGSGPVYGARELVEPDSGGVLLCELDLERTDADVVVPAVVPDPAAGAP